MTVSIQTMMLCQPLTEVGIEEDAELRARDAERGPEPPYFWQGEFEDPW